MSTGKRDVYLVIGGSGFLGRHVVEALLARGDSVSVFDIVQRYHDVPFYSGDISEEEQVSDALRKVRPGCLVSALHVLNGKCRTERRDVHHPHGVPHAWSGRPCALREGQC